VNVRLADKSPSSSPLRSLRIAANVSLARLARAVSIPPTTLGSRERLPLHQLRLGDVERVITAIATLTSNNTTTGINEGSATVPEGEFYSK